MDRIKRINKVFHRFSKSDKIHEAVLLVEDHSGRFSCHRSYEGLGPDSPIFLASNTKQFTTAVILMLEEQGQLSLDDKLSRYFPTPILEGLHIYEGTDWSFTLTLRHLLFHTSGLPDYFMQDQSLLKRIIQEDFTFSFLEMVAATKMQKPHFRPGEDRKAFYSNANFDLLNKVIELVTAKPLGEVYHEMIFKPLEMYNTYLATEADDYIPGFYFGDRLIHRPKVIRSLGGSVGGISTSRELMIFLKAFFDGRLFSLDSFQPMKDYRKLQVFMRPLRYGGGHMLLPLSKLPPFFRSDSILLGHSGIAGSFAFYDPLKDLFFTGNLNQIGDPSLPIRIVLKLARALQRS